MTLPSKCLRSPIIGLGRQCFFVSSRPLHAARQGGSVAAARSLAFAPLVSSANSTWIRTTDRAFSTDQRPTKHPRESHTFAAEVMGSQSLSGKGIRISAGEVLKVIDLAASFAACLHAGDPNCTTLAFDHVELLVPIMHGDLLHLDSRVAHVGNSSIIVQVVGRKKDILTRRWIYTVEAFVTFVALGPDKKPRMVPELVSETEEEDALRQFLQDRRLLNVQYDLEQKALEGPGALDLFRPDVVNEGHSDYIRMSDTTLMLRKNFLPRALNHLGTVFGGDLLEFMNSAAVSCATHFSRNPHLITIAMDRVFFHRPILPSDVLELKATVAYSRRHCIQVEVQVDVLAPPWAHPSGVGIGQSHRGRFHLLSLSEAGHKQPVGVGLSMEAAEERLRYAKASHAFSFWRGIEERKRNFKGGMFGEGVSHSPWGFPSSA